MDSRIDENVFPEINVDALFDIATKGENWTSLVAPYFWNKEWLEPIKKLLSLAPHDTFKLLNESMRHMPKEWGQLIRKHVGRGNRLLVLLQDNYFNWLARLNQSHILKALTYTGCVKLVCSSGASGAVDTSSISSFPDREVRLKTAYIFLRSLELTAEEFCQIVDNTDFIIWGVEDEQLYKTQLKLNTEGKTTEMLKIHKDIPSIYLDNTLKKMEEIKVSEAILTTGAHDLLPISKTLKDLDISFFWIKGFSQDPDNVEEYNKLIVGKRRPISELLNEPADDKAIPEF